MAGVTTKYRYGLERLGSVRGSTTTWEYHDRQGSVRLELTGTGSLNQALRYDAWGQVLSGAPAPFGYTGELRSATTGLEYLRARWYNPATGTLLGRDPFAGFPESPYSLHPYQYGYSQPTRWSDPSGQCIPYVEANCLPVWELGQGPNWNDGGQAIWESIQAIGSPGMLVSDFFTGRNDFGEFWSDLTPSKVAGGVFLGVTLCGGAIRALAARFPTLFSGSGAGAADRAVRALDQASPTTETVLQNLDAALPTLTPGPGGKMLGEAIRYLGEVPPQERATVMGELFKQIINTTTEPGWAASSMPGVDGASAWSGETHTLVIDASGRVFAGIHTGISNMFGLVNGELGVIDWSSLSLRIGQ